MAPSIGWGFLQFLQNVSSILTSQLAGPLTYLFLTPQASLTEPKDPPVNFIKMGVTGTFEAVNW